MVPRFQKGGKMSDKFPETPESKELREMIFKMMPDPKSDLGYHFTNAIMDALITDLIVLCDGNLDLVAKGLDAFIETAKEKLLVVKADLPLLYSKMHSQGKPN